jgi:hypothetical protein
MLEAESHDRYLLGDVFARLGRMWLCMVLLHYYSVWRTSVLCDDATTNL